MRSDVEETETHKTKDSGYSNSCSNSQSQRSSGSSKSHSTSSGSSGYCGHLANSISDGDKTVKRKEKEHKKKKDVSGGGLKEPASLPELPLPVEKRKGTVEGGEESSESLQRAALTQTLTTMKRIKCKELSPDVENSSHGQSVEKISEDDVLQLFKADSSTSHEEEVGVVVSMLDGLVVHTTPSLCQLLGYPRDMWVGRSLIDFVHPMHRASFAGHITSVIANSHNGSPSGRRNSFSCYLRQYRGLRNSGFSITEKWVGYLPCNLGMNFKEVSGYGEAARFYLVITATPIRSAYKYGDETVLSPKFTTRHTASAQLCHVDPEVTPYFGYLPQDMLGRSVLDYYHPEDLHFIKEVYEAVMKEQGHLFRSKPYRFRCQNGTFALVETEVSSFIQPWSRKLEFVICQHTVLRGPSNPDVTTPVSEPEPLQISEEVLKETKIVQEEIKCLLNETLVHNSETAKQQVSKRCKDLAAFMENLMDELTKPPDPKVDVPTEEQSFSERDSVMFGEISPHHEYYDSKSSSETPPSYNQLNYNENIQRFFESKPKTTISDESGESKVGSGGEEGKISPVIDSSSGCKSGGSGGSSGAQSSESNSAATGENSGSNVNTGGSNSKPPVDQCYKPATLTEQLLSRHNEDMEKQMVQRHREQRCKSERDLKAKERVKPNHEKDEGSPHGVKRSGSHSWEGEPYKTIKASHNTPEAGSAQQEPKNHTSQLFPFSTRPDYRGPAFASTLMPMYYIANGRTEYPLFSQQNVPYLSGMVYHPAVMFGPQPLVYSPLAMVHQPSAATHQEMAPSLKNNQEHSISPPQGSCGVRQMSAVVSSQKQLIDQNSSNDTSNPFDDSNSSFYSLLKTDKSDESLRSLSENDIKTEESAWNKQRRTTERMKPKKVAPWLENVNLNSDLVLKYQMKERPLQQILSQDLNQLQTFNQPQQVSEQLSQMYLDLELEGLSKQLTLEEGVTSSSESSEDEDRCHNICSSQRKKYMEYDKMAILFEEDAPLPPPIQSCT